MIDDHDVSTWPEWADCPWRRFVPDGIKIVRGGKLERLSLWWPEHNRHVDVVFNPVEAIAPDFFPKTVMPMIDALAGSVFEKKHPGALNRMIKREAEWLAMGGTGKPPADAALWAEYDALPIAKHYTVINELGAPAA